MNRLAANTCLERVNAIRKAHGSPELEIGTELCEEAQYWAEEIAKTNKLVLSPDKNRVDQGESLYGSNAQNFVPTMAIDCWYGEIQKYDFSDAKFQQDTGNFTQLVWANSKKFGLGYSTSSDGWHYVVARFSPAGNLTITPPGEKASYENNVKSADKNHEIIKTLEKNIEKQEKGFSAVTKREVEEFLKHLNGIRENHLVPRLELDETLINSATAWSADLAKKDTALNSSTADIGECVFSYKGPGFQLNSAIDKWYSGKDGYDFHKPTWKPECGNFTQLVWQSSQKVGVGASCSESGVIYVVAHFKPAGNMILTPPGEEESFRKNVFPSLPPLPDF